MQSVNDAGFHRPSYDLGYADGESSASADWFHALSEFLELDIDDGDLDSPMKAVLAINAAVARIRRKE